MKNIIAAGAAILATATSGLAGGLDRSGQGIDALFESGNHAELSFGYVMPNVSGIGPNATLSGLASSGNVAPAYSALGFSIKTDLNDKLSMALIFDQPFGAAVEYSDPGYVMGGTSAHVNSSALTALGRYKISDAFSLHAGLRFLTATGDVTLPAVPYASSYGPGSGTGYVVGAAFEKPEIALRVALTYSSAIDLELEGDLFNTATTTMPQSVNLDFQSGVAADTLVFGSIRWADWSETAIMDSNLPFPLVSYDQDTLTYSLGVGRRFSDSLAGSVSMSYEKAQGGLASDLSPTDGSLSLQVGAAYTLTNGVEISGGVRYVWLGDATTETAGGSFTDNSAIGVGIKVGYSF